MSTEITSPPYPPVCSRSEQVYEALGVLGEWAAGQLEEIQREAPCEHKSGPGPPPLSVYQALGCLRHAQAMYKVRQFREQWDAIIRDHEDSWDSKLALSRRHDLVVEVIRFLGIVFVSTETLEARNEQQREQMLEMIPKPFRSMFFPQGLPDAPSGGDPE